MCSARYLNFVIEDGEAQLSVEAEGVDVPALVRLRHGNVAILKVVLHDRDVVPGPVAVQPIIKILASDL